MAGNRLTAQTTRIPIGTASGVSAKTILQISCANDTKAKVKGFNISFDGVSTTQKPICVIIARQSNAGTMSSLNVQKLNKSMNETPQTTASHTATVEPTQAEVLRRHFVHPQDNFPCPFPESEVIVVEGGARLGMKLRTATGVEVEATGSFTFEE